MRVPSHGGGKASRNGYNALVDYTLTLAWRYLRARKRGAVSVIGTISVVGITLGVAALCAVLAVTSGFQSAFREKVLGVNAHLLVLKYGWDFSEYREVLQRVRAVPGVVGAAPFLVNPMMITRGDRIAGVLVKGVDPTLLSQVLDLPTYMDPGSSIAALRRPGATPPSNPSEDPNARDDRTLEDYLARSRAEVRCLRHEGQDCSGPRPAAAPASPTGLASPPSPRLAPPVDPLPSGATGQYELPGAGVGGVDPLEQLSTALRTEAETEAQQHAADLPGVILGGTLAENLGVRRGDTVRIMSPLTGADAALVRHGNTPRTRDFRVVGIFHAGFDEYDSRLVYVDLWEAQRFFDQGDAVTGLELRLRDLERASAIGRRIERELGSGTYHTLDWEALNHNLFTALRTQKFALSLVITTIILVAAFNVVATLVMTVLDKRREIAILKAMGAPWSDILRVFQLQGLAVGALGTGLGLALGAGVCLVLRRFPFPLDPRVYLISHVPVQPSALDFTVTAVVALLITLMASLIPAAWAARLTPLEGLRHDG